MEVKLEGLEAVLKNLTRLNVSEELEGLALNKGGKLTQEAIKNEAPVDKREAPNKASLRNNIRLRRPKNGEVVIHTGGAFHAHLVEFGRSAGSTTLKNGRKVKWGKTNPNPFFSRGYEQSKEEALNAIIGELQKGLGL